MAEIIRDSFEISSAIQYQEGISGNPPTLHDSFSFSELLEAGFPRIIRDTLKVEDDLTSLSLASKIYTIAREIIEVNDKIKLRFPGQPTTAQSAITLNERLTAVYSGVFQTIKDEIVFQDTVIPLTNIAFIYTIFGGQISMQEIYRLWDTFQFDDSIALTEVFEADPKVVETISYLLTEKFQGTRQEVENINWTITENFASASGQYVTESMDFDDDINTDAAVTASENIVLNDTQEDSDKQSVSDDITLKSDGATQQPEQFISDTVTLNSLGDKIFEYDYDIDQNNLVFGESLSYISGDASIDIIDMKGDYYGLIAIYFTLYGQGVHDVTIYHNRNGAHSITLYEGSLTGLTASLSGETYKVVWNSLLDIPETVDIATVKLSFTVQNQTLLDRTVETSWFNVKNDELYLPVINWTRLNENITPSIDTTPLMEYTYVYSASGSTSNIPSFPTAIQLQVSDDPTWTYERWDSGWMEITPSGVVFNNYTDWQLMVDKENIDLNQIPGSVVLDSVGAVYSPSGHIVTGTIDASGDVGWGKITEYSNAPANTLLAFYTRSSTDVEGEGSITGKSWNSLSGNSITSPSGRYLQAKAVLETTDTSVSPELKGFTVDWEGDVLGQYQPSVPIGASGYGLVYLRGRMKDHNLLEARYGDWSSNSAWVVIDDVQETVGINPIIIWKNVGDNDWPRQFINYDLRVSKDPTFAAGTTLIENIQGENAVIPGYTLYDFVNNDPLEPNENYYVQVRANDGIDTGRWSRVHWFFTSTFNAPDAPTDLRTEYMINPTNLTVFVPFHSWTYNDPNPSGIQSDIRLQVGSASGYWDIWDTDKLSWSASGVTYATPNPSGNYVDASDLERGQLYYWRLRVWNNLYGSVGSSFSTVNTFKINQLPTAPVASGIIP